MTYVLRHFFDAGSGICLWAGNDAARSRFGGPVDAGVLPISPALRREISDLCTCYDTSLNWADPAGPSPWSPAESEAFAARADSALGRLRLELGSQFVVDDQRRNPLAD